MTECNQKDLHELWLMIIANMKFASEEAFNKWWDEISKILSDEDIKYLIQYLKEQT